MAALASKRLIPGFQTICGRTMHVIKLPGLNPRGANIVLLHGIAASAALWMPLVKGLSSIARSFLLLDLPGHGLSPDPGAPFSCLDAYACVHDCLVRNLDPESRNLIIGNSLGGAFALKFCDQERDLADKCVLISPAGAPFPTTAADIIKPFLASSITQAFDIIRRVFRRVPKAAYLIGPAILHQAKQKGFISLMHSIMDIDNHPDGEMAHLLFTPELLRQFSIPSLCIWGKQDCVLPQEMCAFFDKYLPNSTERYFPEDLGHCPQYENPAAMAEVIVRWYQHTS